MFLPNMWEVIVYVNYFSILGRTLSVLLLYIVQNGVSFVNLIPQ